MTIGFKKLNAECKQALTNHVNDLIARFKAKSKRWTNYCKKCNMSEIVPAESHIELWPNVPKCVFISVPLDYELSPDNSRIDHENHYKE
jgi:hypothetical protein